MKTQEATEIIFNNEGDFQAYRSAEYWAKQNGYSYGSMCSPQPTALFKGDCYVAKWRNLSNNDRRQVDGIITGEYRSGPVKITLYSK
jgi:hypothetical protein